MNLRLFEIKKSMIAIHPWFYLFFHTVRSNCLLFDNELNLNNWEISISGTSKYLFAGVLVSNFVITAVAFFLTYDILLESWQNELFFIENQITYKKLHSLIISISTIKKNINWTNIRIRPLLIETNWLQQIVNCFPHSNIIPKVFYTMFNVLLALIVGS